MDDGTGTMVTQWTGWLRTIDQIDRHTGLDRAQFEAYGVISRLNPPRQGLQQQSVEIDQQTNITTRAAARLLFDPDGTRTTGDHVVDGIDYRQSYINGNRAMARWWAARPRLVELRDLEQTEGGICLGAERRVYCDGLIGASAERRPISRWSGHFHRSETAREPAKSL